MPLQIAPAGLVRPSADEIAALAQTFAASHLVRLPGLLHPAILRRIQSRLASADSWKTMVHPLEDKEAVELVCTDAITIGLLTVMFDDPALFTIVRAVTGCASIAGYLGRIYRMDAQVHGDVWHDDVDGTRILALSLNLTDGVYAGGELHLRARATGHLHAQAANTGPGDAIMFRVDPGLEHMVTPVTGGVSKIAWAGWFRGSW